VVTGWIAGLGSVAALLIFIGGVFLKDQDDISSLKQAEIDHSGEDGRAFALLQAEIDRRLGEQKEALQEIREARGANDDKLGARIDALSEALGLRLAELQRQVSAIEGKLGDSAPQPKR